MTGSTEPIDAIRRWLAAEQLDGLILPSTDTFLSEFAPPADRYIQWATGFTGSTASALILRDSAALIIDGRYLAQARSQFADSAFEAVPVSAQGGWMRDHLPQKARIGLDSWRQSCGAVDRWRERLELLGAELAIVTGDPIAALWTRARPAPHLPSLSDYPDPFCGAPRAVKERMLRGHIREHGYRALLVCDPEDVSWLLNVRALGEEIRIAPGDWHVVPACSSRAIIDEQGITWFVDRDRLPPELLDCCRVNIQPPDALTRILPMIATQGLVAGNRDSTPHALAKLIENHGGLTHDDVVARNRWRKDQSEVEAAKRIHLSDAVAVVRLLAWLNRELPKQRITEFDAAVQLETFRREDNSYIGCSMPAMCASGASGAEPHYVPCKESSRALNDHPIFWLDSGGQYLGGSTDNTVTFAFTKPSYEHIKIHSLVVKAWLALARSRFPVGTKGFRLDTIARQVLWQHGMDYDHATGHGVGNLLNIHEGPAIGRNPAGLGAAPLEAGMIIANEPGYYAAGDFGVRIESHMVVVPSRYENFLEFETISFFPIDARLVDFALFSTEERLWLSDYHQRLVAKLAPRLPPGARSFLHERIQPFLQASGLDPDSGSLEREGGSVT